MPENSSIKERQDRFEKYVEKTFLEIWAAMDKLRDRLPVWATLFISALSGALGFALTVAFK